jgi:hypothetical protein
MSDLIKIMSDLIKIMSDIILGNQDLRACLGANIATL